MFFSASSGPDSAVSLTSKASVVPAISSSKSTLAHSGSDAFGSLTSPAAVTSSSTVQAGSPNGSSRNMVVIAVPVAVGAGLVVIFVLLFWWWKRRRSVRGSYQRRIRPNDPEMSHFSSDAEESLDEPKHAPDEHGMSASSVPDLASTVPEQHQLQSPPVNVETEPRIQPGLAPKSPSTASFSPPATFVCPPPYRKLDRRSDSPSILLADAIEPLDVTKSPKSCGPVKRPVSAQPTSSLKRHRSSSRSDDDWPLPSTYGTPTPETDRSDSPPQRGPEGGKSEWSQARPYLPHPASMVRLGRGDGIVGPSSPPPTSRHGPAQASVNSSEPDPLRQSPFDDDSTDNKISKYSISTQDQGRPSSMLNVGEGRHINEDGISEMSVSSPPSHRNSRLHHRGSDEVSAVSSFTERREEEEEEEEGVVVVVDLHGSSVRRPSAATATPERDDA